MELKIKLSEEEKKSVEMLYEQHLPILRSIVKKYCFSPALRDDVLQEVSLHMLDLLQKFDPTKGMSVKNYLYLYLKGRVIEITEVFRQEETADEETLDSYPSRQRNDSSSIDELIPGDMSVDDLNLLKLYYEERLSVREIKNDLHPLKNYRRIQALLERLGKANG